MKTNIIHRCLCLVSCCCISHNLLSVPQDTQTIHLDKGSYQVDYRPDLGIPSIVSWSVGRADLGSIKRSSNLRFKTDKDTPKPRVTSALYTHSGYQRGHMCPSADRTSSKVAMKQTFIMSNVCPMTTNINTGAWKRVEEKERLIAREKGQCHVIAASFFFPWDTAYIGGHRVAVPHAFFKILYGKNPPKVYGMFLIENR